MKLEAAMLTGPFKRPAWAMIRRLAGSAFEQWHESNGAWLSTHWLPCPADILADDYAIVVPGLVDMEERVEIASAAEVAETLAEVDAFLAQPEPAEPIGGWQGPEPSADAPSDPEADAKLAFDGALESFLMRAQTMIDEYYAKHYKNLKAPKLVKDPGRRYVRIWRRELDNDGNIRNDNRGSAYCFIDKNGDILKPDGWKKPAKHARGNIFDADPLEAVNPHGANYLR